MKKLLILPLLAAFIGVVVASAASTTDLSRQNWWAFNVKPDTASYWDINRAAPQPDGGVQAPVNRFNSHTTGSYLVYLLNYYNLDITGKTIHAEMNWTPGNYENRSSCGDSYVRLEFQDVTAGPYTPNDYWWSVIALDLDTDPDASGILEASLSDRTAWSNMGGRLATDETANWSYGGDTIAQSSYEGFTQATQKVKQVGLSFGNSCRYASGVALVGGTGTFTLESFTVTSP